MNYYDLGNLCQHFRDLLIKIKKHPENVEKLCDCGIKMIDKWIDRYEANKPYPGAEASKRTPQP